MVNKTIKTTFFVSTAFLSSCFVIAPTFATKYVISTNVKNDTSKTVLDINDTKLIQYINSISDSQIESVKNDLNESNIIATIASKTDLNQNVIKKVYVSQGNNTDDNRYSLSLSIVLKEDFCFSDNNNFYNLIDIATNVYDNSFIQKDIFTIENGVLTDITNLEQNQKALFIPNGVTTINSKNDTTSIFETFTQLEVVYLPDTLTSITKYSFLKSSIKSIYIPSNVKSIGYGAFKECINLETVIFDQNTSITQIPGSAFQDSGIQNIIFPEKISIFNYSFLKGTKSLKTVTILNQNPSFKNPTSNDANNTNTFFSTTEQRTNTAKFFVANESVKNQIKTFYSKYSNSSLPNNTNPTISETDILVIGTNNSTGE